MKYHLEKPLKQEEAGEKFKKDHSLTTMLMRVMPFLPLKIY